MQSICGVSLSEVADTTVQQAGVIQRLTAPDLICSLGVYIYVGMLYLKPFCWIIARGITLCVVFVVL